MISREEGPRQRSSLCEGPGWCTCENTQGPAWLQRKKRGKWEGEPQRQSRPSKALPGPAVAGLTSASGPAPGSRQPECIVPFHSCPQLTEEPLPGRPSHPFPVTSRLVAPLVCPFLPAGPSSPRSPSCWLRLLPYKPPLAAQWVRPFEPISAAPTLALGLWASLLHRTLGG